MTAELLKDEASGKMFRCSHCSKEFKYKSDRKRHELSHVPEFECIVCCKKFSYVSALRRHQKQHERSGISVKCEKCNKKFRDEELLKRHMNYAHKGTFICSKCDGPFTSELALYFHMRTHNPESERRFKCSHDGCKKSFNFPHHLKHHELTHTKTKQHYCSVCGKGFIQYYHLKIHLKTHNPSEWVYCEFKGCNKKFSSVYTRKRHMATHKNKPDSGISSDSSSCDASVFTKESLDSVLCSVCGENVPSIEYVKHFKKCGDIVKVRLKKIESGSPVEQEIILKEEVLDQKQYYDKDIEDCKTALGDCIMSGNDCICTEMSKPFDKNYDFKLIASPDSPTFANNNNNTIKENNLRNLQNVNHDEPVILNEYTNITIVEINKALNYKQNKPDMCKGCECASTCNNEERSNCTLKGDKDVPNIEYRPDGVIKIKDTIELDMVKDYKENNDVNQFIPFSSCKDIIGNCIVGASEGCLCARMMVDEQQAMAQEIDDITPKPNTDV